MSTSAYIITKHNDYYKNLGAKIIKNISLEIKRLIALLQ